ncbi:MAG: NAD(P)H-dependent oxidoreductase subunit E [Theionarchaea archaeon]|nr:NAD(P)H-dependent oxidoreductase subunit E [Theionarchaea archaeon]
MKDTTAVVESVLDKWNNDSSCLISILLDIQEELNYLPKETLIMVAEKLGVPLINVYSVATFYKVFSLEPRGDHIINICVGTACHVRGGRRLVEHVEKTLKIGVGETTPDMKFTLETVRCLGACALGPVVVMDNEYHGQMSTKKVDALVQQYK